MKKFRYLKNVATLTLNPDLCTGCRMCIIVCPHAVFTIEKAKAVITDLDACMECGACAKNCSFGALYVRSGVGCAAGILNGILKGKEAACDCSDSGTCC